MPTFKSREMSETKPRGAKKVSVPMTKPVAKANYKPYAYRAARPIARKGT